MTNEELACWSAHEEALAHSDNIIWDGGKSYLAGKRRADNPYDQGSDNYSLWQYGNDLRAFATGTPL